MISKDNIKIILQMVKDNMTLRNLVVIFLISYCTVTYLYLPQTMIIFLNQPIIKMIALLSILYYSQKDIFLSILLSFGLLLTINVKQTLDLSYMFNREDFTAEQDSFNLEELEDQEDIEDEIDDEESTGDTDNSDDPQLDKFTQNHPELRDGFAKLHNAIHDYENYMNN